jgi:hypothetical protein
VVTVVAVVAVVGGGLLLLLGIIVLLDHAGRAEMATYGPAATYSMWTWADTTIDYTERHEAWQRTPTWRDTTVTDTDWHTPEPPSCWRPWTPAQLPRNRNELRRWFAAQGG